MLGPDACVVDGGAALVVGWAVVVVAVSDGDDGGTVDIDVLSFGAVTVTVVGESAPDGADPLRWRTQRPGGRVITVGTSGALGIGGMVISDGSGGR